MLLKYSLDRWGWWCSDKPCGQHLARVNVVKKIKLGFLSNLTPSNVPMLCETTCKKITKSLEAGISQNPVPNLKKGN